MPSPLSFNHAIWDQNMQWILPDSAGKLERNTMLGQVDPSFLRIPFESHDLSQEYVQKGSVKEGEMVDLEAGFASSRHWLAARQRTNAAKTALLHEFFVCDCREVFYGRQLEVRLESRFAHWTTRKALQELSAEKRIRSRVDERSGRRIHFYWALRHRYPRRQIAAISALVEEFSAPDFTNAVGGYAELLADAAFARIGARIVMEDVDRVGDRHWSETNHRLDRLIEYDGKQYGVEIKNRLGYIDTKELEVKLRMCVALGVTPLFITREMPRAYALQIVMAGGMSICVGTQQYPPLAGDLALRVLRKLRLPIGWSQRQAEHLFQSRLGDAITRRMSEVAK